LKIFQGIFLAINIGRVCKKKVCGNKELCSKSILIHGKNKQKEYCNWPSFFKLLDEGKIKFDGEGRPRWFQATTVGDVMLA
tara:strand:- start:123 stop:365 length:243 start_codon:yes stop_codon:yes gene_type:complete